MSKGNKQARITITTKVTSQTAHNLVRLSNQYTRGDMGKVIDQLVRSYCSNGSNKVFLNERRNQHDY